MIWSFWTAILCDHKDFYLSSKKNFRVNLDSISYIVSNNNKKSLRFSKNLQKLLNLS